MLITTQTLNDQLDSADLLIFDTRSSLQDTDYGHRAYTESHIPGARFADLESDLSGPVIPGTTGRHPLPSKDKFTQKLQQWGITQHSSVVIYDDGNNAISARLWWMLKWAGLENVALLDGGFQAWRAESRPTDAAIPDNKPSVFSPDFQDDMLVSVKAVLDSIGRPDLKLVDARALPRFCGEVEPIDPVAGHIPSALCFPFEGNLNPAGTFASQGELKERFSSLFTSREATTLRPICYCGSGVTACHNIFAMVYAGYPMPRLYPGSWSEWITDSERPVER